MTDNTSFLNIICNASDNVCFGSSTYFYIFKHES